MTKSIISAIAATALTACGGTEDTNPFRSAGTTTSGFAVTVPVAGGINSDLSSRSGNEIDGSNGGGVAYQVGIRNMTEFRAIAGVRPNTTVSDLPAGPNGTVRYSGQYQLLAVEGVGPGPTGPSATTASASGRFDAMVTLATGAFVGASVGGLDNFAARGTVSGTTLTGTVEFNGDTGTMRGLAGGDQTVAAFHGNTSDTTFAGGFAADATP